MTDNYSFNPLEHGIAVESSPVLVEEMKEAVGRKTGSSTLLFLMLFIEIGAGIVATAVYQNQKKKKESRSKHLAYRRVFNKSKNYPLISKISSKITIQRFYQNLLKSL